MPINKQIQELCELGKITLKLQIRDLLNSTQK